MPRINISPKPKRKRQQWDPENMRLAVQAVQTMAMGYKKAVKMFSVPRTTLRRLAKCTGESIDSVVNRPLGRKCVLPPEIEKELVAYLLFMESKYYGFTLLDVRRMAYQLATKNGIPNPFKKEVAGRAWLDHFLNRHKNELSIRKPTGTSYARVQGFNRAAVNEFFDILEAEYSKKHYPADRIFNVDETGLTIVQSKIPAVIGKKGKRQIGAMTAAERGSLVTLANPSVPPLGQVSVSLLVDPPAPPRQPIPSDSQPGPSSIRSRVILPADILPAPSTKKKTSNRGRKAGTASVITSSPYKRQLEDQIQRSEENEDVVQEVVEGVVADRAEDAPEDAAVVELQHNVALKETSSQTVKMMMANNLTAVILPLETMFL
ncbi:hypothetical protein PYW08_006171 [Mythimna loreyi]|uniref:Uncharacterized protein n=1 Tax=Mythimna loreyi TaxID=667449 RepID=A0ACC2QP03_9NEOP|nr:hypothetical protein PYW08_006171 [Mythimna loreyi]